MPNYTSNLKLEKPLVTDNYDINVSNGNMDKIDLEVKKLQDNKSNNGHTHTKSNITDFAHTHSMGEITGLELSSTKVMRPNQKTVEQSISANETSISLHGKEIENLKSSVSSGKSVVASAITDKGVPTLATDEFSIMANNIRNIKSLDIKVLTELPSEHKEGQLVIVTDKSIGKISLVSSSDTDFIASIGDCILYYLSEKNNKQITINDGNSDIILYLSDCIYKTPTSHEKLDVFISRSGEWVNLFGKVIYERGTIYKDVCGGLELYKGANGSLYTYNHDFNNDHIYTYLSALVQTQYVQSKTTGAINLSGANKIYLTCDFKIDPRSGGASNVKDTPILKVIQKDSGSVAASYNVRSVSWTNQTIELDVSSLQGLYYIAFGSAINVTESGYAPNSFMKAYKIWIE